MTTPNNTDATDRRKTDMGLGPDYGPWTYTLLPEPKLTEELTRLAQAQSVQAGKVTVDSVSFQPSPNPDNASQDRYLVQQIETPSGTWSLLAVLDGHAGHDTVDYIVEKFPSLFSSALSSTGDFTPYGVSALLRRAISSLDESIVQGLHELFPGGVDQLASMSEEEVSKLINDDEEANRRVVRCMRGSTVLVALLDPLRENLWVASLGDCQAVLGTKVDGEKWKVEVLSQDHQGANPTEVNRIRREHPGEKEAVLNDRVLGAIMVTRAIGDHLFKLPRIYTENVFMRARPGFRISTRIEDFLQRNVTPPYVSSEAEVRHVALGDAKGREVCLVMCSDGLVDLYDGGRGSVGKLARRWIEVGCGREEGNRALRLLRDALGGQDEEKVSRMMTVEMLERWMDDTTVVVYYDV